MQHAPTRHRTRFLGTSLVILLRACPLATARFVEPAVSIHPEFSGAGGFGRGAGELGDIDGDGAMEVVIGAPFVGGARQGCWALADARSTQAVRAKGSWSCNPKGCGRTSAGRSPTPRSMPTEIAATRSTAAPSSEEWRRSFPDRLAHDLRPSRLPDHVRAPRFVSESRLTGPPPPPPCWLRPWPGRHSPARGTPTSRRHAGPRSRPPRPARPSPL